MQSSLKVKLLRGEDLLAADSNGLSDPYCILKLDGEQKKKSETVYKSLNPDWSQEFLFNEKLGELGKLLTIECYDRDAMTSDILGKGDVDVTDLSTSPITVTVELHHPKKGNKGKIYLELVRVKETPDEARRNSIVMETKSTSGLGLTTFMKATYRQATKAAAMTFNPQGGKGQKRMITVDVIRGRGVPAMDNNGYADPYCVIRCGKKKRTTRTQFRTHFPEWRERFIFILFDMGGRDSNMLKVDLWDKDTVGMDDKIASLQIDLSGLPLNSTDERWWVLKKHESKSLFGFGSGKKSDSDSVAVDVEVLLLITVADLFQPQLAPEQLALAQKSSHAWLKVNILRAANLPSLDSNGLSDPFVVVEVENRLMRTHTVSKSLDPEWNCLLETPVKDVFECVNVEVYDEDDNGKYELIGKLCIPLLSISNGVPQWYQLKDSSLLHPVQGCIQIAFHLNYEKIPMMVKSIGRRTQRLMERPENFRFKVLKSHIARIKVFVVNLLNGAVFVNKAMTWQISNEVTIGFGIGWVLFWFFVQLWHLSFASLCGILFLGMQKFRGIKFLSGVFEVEDDEEGEEEEVEDGAEDEDDNEDDTSAKAMVKNPMGFRTQMRQMRIMARTVQNVLGDIASALERTRNLFNWASPTLTAICAFGCFVGTIFLMFIPFRYFAMLFGVNRIVRSGLRKYHPAFKRPMYYIPVIPAKEFLLRVPDDLELEERRRLPLPDSFLAEQRDGSVFISHQSPTSSSRAELLALSIKVTTQSSSSSIRLNYVGTTKNENNKKTSSPSKKVITTTSYYNYYANPSSIGHRSIGGFYDGTKMTIFYQIKNFPKVPKYKLWDDVEKVPHPSWEKYVKILFESLHANGWERTYIDEEASLFLTRRIVPPKIHEEHQIVNSLGLCNCIGGTKAQQLNCRRQYVRSQGCEFEQLNIQPTQLDMSSLQDCHLFWNTLAKYPKNIQKVYIAKPINSKHGDGIQFFYGINEELTKMFSPCSKKNNYILMDYVASPALIDHGYKFDLRSYMVVASMKPQLVFMYKEVLIRRATSKYSLNSSDSNVHIMNARNQSMKNHFFNLIHLQHSLSKHSGWSTHYVEQYLLPRMKAVSRFMFETENFAFQQKNLIHRAGRYHLFAMDWVIDSNGHVYLLEGNRFPLIVLYPKSVGITPNIWVEMIQLIQLIQTNTKTKLLANMTVSHNYEFGGWQLVFNEIEELYEGYHGRQYNACTLFQDSSLPINQPNI